MESRGSSLSRCLTGIAMLALLWGGCSMSCGASGPTTPQLTGPYATAPAEGSTPPVTNPIPVATPTVYASWVHPNLAANEQVTFTLTAVNVGAAAPPNTVVASAQVAAAAAGANHGTTNFSAPAAGWPPGQYRITATGTSVGQFGALDFTIQ